MSSYISLQIVMKSLGAATGFAIAAISYQYLDIQIILMVLSVVALLSGLYASQELKKERAKSQN